jgi:hypothetical protein
MNAQNSRAVLAAGVGPRARVWGAWGLSVGLWRGGGPLPWAHKPAVGWVGLRRALGKVK